MGIAQAGIAFRTREPIGDLALLLGRLFAEEVAEIASPVGTRFDIRNRSDVMVQLFGDVCFVSNDALAWPLLKDDADDGRRLHACLGAPALLVAFCRFDAGGSHGYAVFERGRRIRRRLQTRVPGLEPLAQSGEPQPFEQRWLRAAHFVGSDARPDDKTYYLGDREVLVPAAQLTGRMLHDGLEAMFGVCPWDTLITPTYRFFHVGRPHAHAHAHAHARAQAPAGVAVTTDDEPSSTGRRARRAWWPFR